MPLTAAQTEAVTTVDRPVAVIAGAGSGKTRVLTERYRYLITDLKVPPHRILAFTFTEKAAGEIKERILKEKIVRPEEESLTHIGTIHSFCSRLLRRYGPSLGLDPSFTIVSETDALIKRDNRIKRHIINKLNQKGELIVELTERFGFSKLNKIFQSLLSEPQFFLENPSHLTSEKDEKELLAHVQSFFTTWLDEKMSTASLTFDDLEFLSASLLKKNKEISEEVSRRFDHILVDEYQDTNPLQTIIINELSKSNRNHLFIVGDPKQSIYRFRQADVRLFKKTVQEIKKSNGNLIQLNESFRIPSRLTDSLNKVFTPLFNENQEESLYRPLVSHHDQIQGKLQIIMAPDDKIPLDKLRRLEARWIASHLVELQLPPSELRETALLFRTGAPMTIYQEELNKAGIPTHVTRTRDLLIEPEIRDSLHLLAYLAGEKSHLVQTGILRSSFFNFSEAFIERYIRSGLRDFLASHTPDLFVAAKDHQQWQRLVTFISKWEKLKLQLSPFILFQTILSDLELNKKNEPQNKLHLEQWIHILDTLESMENLTLSQLNEMMKWIQENEEEIETLDLKTESDSVQLLTIHAAKGLEFTRVFLPQLYARSFYRGRDFLFDPEKGIAFKQKSQAPLKGLKIQLEETPFFTELRQYEERENREESKRLLYVAMTRAKKDLFLFLKQTKKKIPLKDSKNLNDWLVRLLEKELEKAIALPTGLEKTGVSPAWSGLATKLEEAFRGEEGLPASTVSHTDQPNPLQETAHSKPSYKPVYPVSAIETYLRCEKEFELKYIDGVHPLRPAMDDARDRPSPPPHPRDEAKGRVAPQQWGLLVHEVMQYLDFNQLSNEQTVVEQALMNQQIPDPDRAIETNIKKIIERLKQKPEIWNYLSGAQTSYTELPFILDCEEFYLKGTLDRLAQIDDTWMVLDYKTDRIGSPAELNQRQASYAGQMACYALATSQILKIDRLKTVLLFTQGPYLKIQEWKEEDLNRVKQQLREVHQTICFKKERMKSHDQAEQSPHQEPSFHFAQDLKTCHHCPYYELNYCGVKNS